jgi:hypothetical protein
MMCTLAVLALLFWGERAGREPVLQGVLQTVVKTLSILGGLYLAIFVWLVSHAIYLSDVGTVVALLLYTFTAIVLYTMHRSGGKQWMRYVAGALVTFVVGRLLVVDAWNMGLGERVLVFLLVGVSLMTVAWLERTYAKKSLEVENSSNQ